MNCELSINISASSDGELFNFDEIKYCNNSAKFKYVFGHPINKGLEICLCSKHIDRFKFFQNQLMGSIIEI